MGVGELAGSKRPSVESDGTPPLSISTPGLLVIRRFINYPDRNGVRPSNVVHGDRTSETRQPHSIGCSVLLMTHSRIGRKRVVGMG